MPTVSLDNIPNYSLAAEFLNRLLPHLVGHEKCLHCSLANGTTLLEKAGIITNLRGSMAEMARKSGVFALNPADAPSLLGQVRELLMDPAHPSGLAPKNHRVTWWFRNIISVSNLSEPDPLADNQWLIRRAAQRIEWATHTDALGAIKVNGNWEDLPEPPLRTYTEALGTVRQFLIMEGGGALRLLHQFAEATPPGTYAEGPQATSADVLAGVHLWVGSPVGRAILPEFTSRTDWSYRSPGIPVLQS